MSGIKCSYSHMIVSYMDVHSFIDCLMTISGLALFSMNGIPTYGFINYPHRRHII